MDLEAIISRYGYAVVLIGTFLEGETILVIAGFLAHRGQLNLPLVILAALAGTMAGDQLFFYLGRWKGTPFLEKRPAWKAGSQRARDLLERHQTWVVLGFRFVYGIRTVTPFLVGVSRIRPGRFAVFNFLGAAAWAMVVGGLGYLLGHAVELFLEDVKRYERTIIAGLLALGAILWLGHRYRLRKRGAGPDKSG